jgi:ABC-type amino acid transport substrate-binding protein
MLISIKAFGYDLPIKACFTQWYPYSYIKNNQPVGLSIDIYNAVIKRAGLTISYENKPWARCKLEFSLGKFNALVDGSDLIPNSFNAKQRPIPWAKVFWVRKESHFHKYLDYSQFDKKVVGYVRGYDYPKEFIEYQGFRNIVSVKNDLNGLEMLQKGRFDVFYGDFVNNKYLIIDNNLSIRALTPISELSYLTLSFSEQLSIQHEKFETALNKMYQDGSIDLYYMKYFGVTYKEFIKKYVND